MAAAEDPPNIVCAAKARVGCKVDLLWTLLYDWSEYPALYDSRVTGMICHERDAETKRSAVRTMSVKDPKMAILHRVSLSSPQEVVRPDPGGLVPGAPAAEEDIRSLFDTLDYDNNGVLEKREFERIAVDAALRESLVVKPPEPGEDETPAEGAEEEDAEPPKVLQPFQTFLDKTAKGWEAIFEEMDSDKVFGGRKDGYVSWNEFLAYFTTQAPERSASATLEVEKIGGVPSEVTPASGRITCRIRQVDADVTELVVSFRVKATDVVDVKPWAKSLVTKFKTVAENIVFLCPDFSQNSDTYSTKMHHELIEKAKKMQRMSPNIAKSPSLMGNFVRLPKPGQGDGYDEPVASLPEPVAEA